MSESIRQTIFSDDQTRDLTAELRNLPQRIKETKDLIADTETRFLFDVKMPLEENEALLKQLEDAAKYEATLALDDKGKRKYANDEQRTQAAKMALAGNQEYIDLLNKKKDMIYEKVNRDMQISKQKNILYHLLDQFKASMAICNMINGLAHESWQSISLGLYHALRRGADQIPEEEKKF